MSPAPASRPGQAAPQVTPRRMLALALPMTLSHVTTPLLGLVGSTAVGRLGDAALLGAIALGAILFDVLFWSFGSLRMATAGLTAQAVGAGRPAEADLTLARALLLAAAIGTVMVLAQGPIGAAAFALMGASSTVQGPLTTYFRIRVLAAPFTLANYAILGSTLGRGRSDLGLVLQVAINLVNIALTVALVSGLGVGIAGAGLATVAAEAAGVGLGLAILHRTGARPFAVARAALLERAAMARMLALNRDVMIRTAALLAAFMVFASRSARSGDTVLAANAVLQNIFLIGGYFLDGFATAAEILCGQAIGARDEGAFRRAARLTVLFSLGFGALVAALSFAGGQPFVDTVTTNTDVRAVARFFLPYAALSPLVGSAAFAFDGIYVGATWTAAMRNLMLVALVVYLAALSGLHDLGNRGLWIALLVFLGARGLGQALLYPGLVRRTFTPPGRPAAGPRP